MIDLHLVPFSRYGSYFAIVQDKENRIVFKDIHGGWDYPCEIFYLTVFSKEGEEIKEISVSECEIIIGNQENFVRICFGEENTLHMQAKGLAVRLVANKTRYDSLNPFSENQYEYHCYTKETKMLFTLRKGQWALDAPWEFVGNKKIEMIVNADFLESEMLIEGYKSIWKPREYAGYETDLAKVNAEFDMWQRAFPLAPDYEESRNLAVYILWSSVVAPEGTLPYYTMYMSKNGMNNIWSWDNCFNALALSESFPDLAYDQLRTFIKYQDEFGIYPDLMNDKFVSYNCCKPPVWAWAFLLMKKRNDFFKDSAVVEIMYETIVKQTNYWLKYRRKSKDVLPAYMHGNDSGWDNASIFHQGMPVEAPDLGAHLIRQMDILSKMAKELGKSEEEIFWKKEADALYDLLIKRYLDDDGFFAIYEPTGEPIQQRTSLILYLPLIIGYRLPKDLVSKMVEKLKTDFETPYGLATESVCSQLYKEDGYWLGPIWGAPTLLIADALLEIGYKDFANNIIQKFFELTKVGMMAENFHAFTGKGLSDPAFTWTSGIFITLLNINCYKK